MNETNVVADPLPAGCQVCGRRDETVRFVVYPYVVSLIVVTFQRAFSGCWCRVHRFPRWLAATLISSIFGWLGIPFGLLFTPISLLQLARGGVEDKNINGQILLSIGEERYRQGDLQGAIRCFEASLLYVDKPEINEQLRALYRSQSTGSEFLTSGLSSLFVFPAIAILFGGIGIFVGFVDFLVQWASSFIATEFPIYIVILLQVPFVILVFFCIVLLSQTLQATIRFTRSHSLLFLMFASIIIVLLFFNGINAGETFGAYLSYVINGFQESWSDTWATLGAILTRGSFYIFRPALFRTNPEGTVLFAVLMLLSIIFSLLVLLPRVRDLASQYARRKQLQSMGGQLEHVSSLPGWAGLTGIVLISVLLFVVTPQKTSVDTIEAFDHIGLAFGHVNSGEYDQAISEYEQAIDLKPGFPFSYAGLGYVYYFSGYLEPARLNFQKALDLAPETLEALAGLGWVFLEEGNFEFAEKKFREVLQIDPANLDAHLGMGWVYLDQSKLQESQQEFEGVIAVAPDLPGGYLGMGGVFFAANDYDSALDSLKTATQLDPNFVLAYVYTGNIYLWQDLYSDAERAFQNALRIQPDNYDALVGIGQLNVYQYKFTEGMEYYDQAIKINSSRTEALFGKAALLAQMGKFEEAASIAESMDQENELTLPILVYIYYQLNRTNDADQLLRAADERANQLTGMEQARAYTAIAGTYSSLYNFPEAKHYLQLAEASYPAKPDSDFFITSAYILSAMGEFNEAEAALQQVTQIGHSDFALSMARASLLIDQQNLPDAEREFQTALQIDKNSANAHSLLSFVLYLNGDFEQAIQEAQEAIQLNRYNGGAYTHLAFAYQANGRTEDAILMAREAIRLDTLNGLPHYVLGICYMEKGMNAEAITEFKTFLDNYWDRAYLRDFKLKAEEYLAQLSQVP